MPDSPPPPNMVVSLCHCGGLRDIKVINRETLIGGWRNAPLGTERQNFEKRTHRQTNRNTEYVLKYSICPQNTTNIFAEEVSSRYLFG